VTYVDAGTRLVVLNVEGRQITPLRAGGASVARDASPPDASSGSRAPGSEATPDRSDAEGGAQVTLFQSCGENREGGGGIADSRKRH